MDELKRKLIREFIDGGIADAAAMITSVGGVPMEMDEIDRQLMVDKMYDVCVSSGEEMQAIEDFFKSDEYKTYVESVSAMTDVILKEAAKSIPNKTIH